MLFAVDALKQTHETHETHANKRFGHDFAWNCIKNLLVKILKKKQVQEEESIIVPAQPVVAKITAFVFSQTNKEDVVLVSTPAVNAKDPMARALPGTQFHLH